MPRESPAISITLKCILESPQGDGWHFIPVPKKTGEKFPSDGKSRRVICTINETESFHCALMPGGERFVIMVNKRIRTALQIKHGSKISVELKADTSQYGMPMPEEFAEVLKQDPDGNKFFHKLTPGKQRSLIYTVLNAKDVDRRIHTALIILEHLNENDGRIDQDALHQELRRPLI
jgi:hypothetical protein